MAYHAQLKRVNQVGNYVVLTFNFTYFWYSHCCLLVLKLFLVVPTDIADPRAITPSLRLVNKASLDKVLQAEIYVNESDGQIRAAHLILGYNPISCAFQALSCVIRPKDPRLCRISVAYEGFIVLQGIPLPRYSPLAEPLPVASLAVVATSSPFLFQVEEEEEVEQEEEGFVDLTSAADDYEIFNQSTPSPNTPEDMGIQRKPQRSLQELLESQPGRGEAGRSAQPKLPPPFLNLLFVPLSHLLPPGLNNLTLRGEGSPRAKK